MDLNVTIIKIQAWFRGKNFKIINSHLEYMNYIFVYGLF